MDFPDFSCEQGERLLLLGNSGTGKTTLLHLLCGLLTPESGSIRVADLDLTQASDRTLDAWRGRDVGIVFQQAHFVQSLTMERSPAPPIGPRRRACGEVLDRMGAMLDRLGIAHRAKAIP